MGKSRLAPLKAMTIPCLELTAATISVRIGGMVSRELDDPVDSETYWTDSTTVLKYIRSEAFPRVCSKSCAKYSRSNRTHSVEVCSIQEQPG